MKRPTLPLSLAITALSIASLSAANAAYDESWWPTATPDVAKANTGESITIPVLSNDLGISLQLSSVNTTTTGLGSATLSADKQSVVYQSAKRFSGTDTFWYDFIDVKGRANAAKVTVEVAAQTTKPLAWPSAGYDTAETTINTSIDIDVLNNDEGTGLTLREVNGTTVKLGKALINVDTQTINYTPPSNFTGTDEFWYVFSDQWGRTNAGKITLSVNGKTNYNGGWPTAIKDITATINTQTVLIPVLENDLGEGLKLIETNATTVKLGKASIEGSQIRYTPPSNFAGEDSFWYAFEDEQGRTNSTQVFITISENKEPSEITFCENNYRSDGTKEGTTITNEPLSIQETVIDGVEVNTFPTQQLGDFAVVGNRRYYLENNDTDLQVILWVEEDGNTKKVLTITNEFTIAPLGIFGDSLFYSATGTTTGVFMNDGDNNTYLGDYPTSLKMLTNKSAPYFKYTGDNAYLETGVQFLRLNEEGTRLNYVAIEYFFNRINQTVFSLFYRDGIDYISKSSSYSSPPTQSYSVNTYQQDFNGETLSTIQAAVSKAVVSENRLFFTTSSVSTTGTNGEITDIPAKLFSVNAYHDIVELATCN